jgi:hypothetical protein
VEWSRPPFQHNKKNPDKPEATEFWDPEVRVITPEQYLQIKHFI